MTKQVNRAEWSEEVGLIKSDLIKSALKRVDSCIKTGHHIEAIALLESLIADRLEAGLNWKKREKQPISTLGPLLRDSLNHKIVSENFCEEIRNWSMERNKILHEMVKVRNSASGNWRSRMNHARQLALEGRQIHTTLATEVRKIPRAK